MLGKVPSWENGEERFAALETRIALLKAELQELRSDWERARAEGNTNSKREEYDALREAVLRYAVACGAVDIQVAMLRARGDNSGEVTENLRRSLEEQTEASNALRALARTLQGTPDRSR